MTVTVDPDSLETDCPFPEQVDFNAMIRGEQFLDTARYPEMAFRSISVEPTGGNAMRIHGELNMHGVTRPVVLDATFTEDTQATAWTRTRASVSRRAAR